jgi:hypothetical protein
MPVQRISFVCQKGRLEPQAVLLAASLRLHFAAGVKLLAAHPHAQGRLGSRTLAALDSLGVEIVPIDNPLDESYLIGHQLAALRLLDGPGIGLFLDSDILVMRKPEAAEALSNALATVPASRQHCSLSMWRHIYESFDLRLPEKAPPTLVTREVVAPYYNSGAIVIPGDLAVRFATKWIECSKQIDSDAMVQGRPKRPYLVQTPLPIAAALLDQSVTVLGPQWNFPSWAWRIPDGSCPIFFHYQNIARLSWQPITLAAARAAASTSPTVEAALCGVIGRPFGPIRDLATGIVRWLRA